MVYQLLQQHGLCDYYTLNTKPGLNRQNRSRENKFAFLDDEKIAAPLIRYRDESQTHVSFYLPQIHCSSCLYLLENLHSLQEGIVSVRVNFTRREADLVFDHGMISLRAVAELLESIGYEPCLSLNDLGGQKPRIGKRLLYQLGVAGFCFGNIMLLSFPEYFGMGVTENRMRVFFRMLNFILAIPVFFFSANPFFISAWKSLRRRFLNIDAPIALAILITYARSVYDISTGRGPGYLDAMSGIVFFMLAGRLLQDKTYQQLSFDRDYSSYFPVAVTRINDGQETPTALPDIHPGDTLLIHAEELIPVDGILTRGQAMIDYSFVTGESLPVLKEMGEILYAGGKQTGNNIELLVIREVAQSYLTRLWSQQGTHVPVKDANASFVHLLSRYFSYIVLLIAASAAVYWWIHDPARIGSSVTAIMIIACPCALLLSSNFTNANILRILGKNHFFLRGPQAIESLATVDHIVFDKTGTLTLSKEQDIGYEGTPLTAAQRRAVGTLAAQSRHPLSMALATQLGSDPRARVTGFREQPGMGIEGWVDGRRILLGSRQFVAGTAGVTENSTRVYVSWEGGLLGNFPFGNRYRSDLGRLIHRLKKRYRLSVLSGDNAGERPRLQQLFGSGTNLRFQQKPQHKKEYVRQMQDKGERVAMIGDGLNDAVALQQSDVGIAVTEDINNFTPACDAILDAKHLPALPAFLSLCRASRRIITTSFVLSIAYNLVGLFFAVQGSLSPLLAAILMPLSSMTILLVTYGSSSMVARLLRI